MTRGRGSLLLWMVVGLALLVTGACRLLSSEVPCTADDHCPYRHECGPAGICIASRDQPRDAGPGRDAGPREDAGALEDAGPGDDAGVTADAGAADDAGVIADAGPSGPPPQWWSGSFALAIELDITGGATSVFDVPVVVDAPLQAMVGARGTLDPESPRVIEQGAAGYFELPSYFSSTNGSGLLAFLLPGELPAGTQRRLYVYVALTEEGGVGPPGYWRNEARNPVEGPAVSIDDLDSMALRVFHMTEPGLAVVLNNSWCLSSTNVDHYAAAQQLGDNTFLALQPTTVRLDEPGMVVVESIASAGPARARQLTLLTSERGLMTALRVEDLEPAAPLEVYAYADIDVPESTAANNIGLIDPSVHAAVIEDAASGQQVALLHDGSGAHETVGYYTAVGAQIRDRALSGQDELDTPADGAAAMKWSFSSVTAPVVVRSATVLVEGRNDAERIGQRFFSASVVLGPVYERF